MLLRNHECTLTSPKRSVVTVPIAIKALLYENTYPQAPHRNTEFSLSVDHLNAGRKAHHHNFRTASGHRHKVAKCQARFKLIKSSALHRWKVFRSGNPLPERSLNLLQHLLTVPKKVCPNDRLPAWAPEPGIESH